MTLKAEKFEEMLSSELTRALEPERGKALAAFRAEMLAQREAPAPIPLARGKSSKDISRREMWLWASAPSLVAACLAVALTLQVAKNGPAHDRTDDVEVAKLTGGEKTIIVSAQQVNQTELTRKSAGGIVMNNDKPMQLIHEQTVKNTQWTDPRDHATYTLTQPAETVGYQEIKPF